MIAPAPPDPNGSTALARIPSTQLALAAEFARQHGDKLRFCPAMGSWLAWTGTRWVHDVALRHQTLAKDTVLSLVRRAAQAEDDDVREQLIRAAARFQNDAAIRAVLNLAKSDLVVTPDQLDRDPWLLNCSNGTVDLRTGEIRPHNPRDLLTMQAGARYNPDASGELWDRFLRRIFQDDATLIDFVQRYLGYGLTGQTREQCMLLCVGSGANGKSVLIDATLAAAGDYGWRADPELLLADGGAALHPTSTASLRGRRIVVLSETDDDRALREAKLKSLTGDSTLTARFMRQDYFQFTPTHSLVMMTNHLPTVRGSDEGIHRRIRLVRFPVTIPEAERDVALLEKLREQELEAILAFLIEGSRRYSESGLPVPKRVQDWTREFRRESDAIGRFLEEACVPSAEGAVPAKRLYDHYTRWCREEGSAAVSLVRFGKAMSERGLEKRRTQSGVVYLGVAISDAAGAIAEGSETE